MIVLKEALYRAIVREEGKEARARREATLPLSNRT